MVTDIGPQPRGGQHIENFCSRFDALESPFSEYANDVVMQHMIDASPDFRIFAEKHDSPFRTTLAESARQREGRKEWRESVSFEESKQLQ